MDEFDKLLADIEIDFEALSAVEKIIVNIRPTERLEKVRALKKKRVAMISEKVNSETIQE